MLDTQRTFSRRLACKFPLKNFDVNRPVYEKRGLGISASDKDHKKLVERMSGK